VGETLPPAVKAPLADLGLWDTFLQDDPSSAPVICSAWGGEALREQNHLYNPYGVGWHIDRRRFDAMLVRAAQEGGAVLKNETTVTACEADPSGRWTIAFRGGPARHRLHARFLLDATGRSSCIARLLGSRRVLYDNLVGIVGFLGQDSENRAASCITLIEAVENGWWYSASLPDSRLVIAYMTDADGYAKGQRHSASKWLEQLSHTTHTQAGAKTWNLDAVPFIVQASSSRLDRVYGHNWLAVGDAALAFDPITGQGVYRALKSGMHGANVVRAFFAGESSAVASYADTLEDSFNEFLILRGKYYSQEGRWPNSVFWRRRQTIVSGALAKTED
jgi:flavin-dependent dehydrogenase